MKHLVKQAWKNASLAILAVSGEYRSVGVAGNDPANHEETRAKVTTTTKIAAGAGRRRHGRGGGSNISSACPSSKPLENIVENNEPRQTAQPYLALAMNVTSTSNSVAWRYHDMQHAASRRAWRREMLVLAALARHRHRAAAAKKQKNLQHRAAHSTWLGAAVASSAHLDAVYATGVCARRACPLAAGVVKMMCLRAAGSARRK